MLHIKNGTVITMGPEGIIENGEVLIDNGKIVEVGRKLKSSGDIIDASGKYVIPGFVDAHSHVGGFRVDGSNEADLNEITSPVTAELSAYYGIDPNCPAFDYIAKFGITTSCIAPGSANVICGLVLAMKSKGDSMNKRVIKDPVALKAAMGLNPKGCYGSKNLLPMSRMGIAKVMREYFMKVKDYMDKKEKAKEDAEKLPPFDLSLEHGIQVLKKEIPLKVHSYQHDMLTVIEIAKEFDFYVTLDHALGAGDFLEELTDDHVKGVIYGPVGSPLLPGELCKIDFDALPKLDGLGVNVAVMTDGPITNCHVLVDEAGEAVRAGMDPIRALAMITINAAKIIQCHDRIGSIEVGKDADILIYDGMPTLDVWASNEMTIIDGKIVYTA